MPLTLFSSLWPVISQSATGRPWPPSDVNEASAFVRAAQKEQLLPILWHDTTLPEHVCRDVAMAREAYLAHVARSAIIQDRLRRIVQLLNGLGEEFILLKGSDFRSRLYPEPHLRPVLDIDILVREGEMERIAGRLVAEGLTRFYPGTLSTRVTTHHETAIGFGTVVIDLHQRFLQKQRHRIDYGSIWKRAVTLEADGFTALRLSDADAAAYLTLSVAIKYFHGPLIHYVDLWLLLQASPGCLDRAAELAAEWRARRAFYAALRYGSRIFPDLQPLFQPYMNQILDGNTRRFLDRWVLPDATSNRSDLSRARQLWRKYWLIDDVALRTQSLAEHAVATIRGYLVAKRAGELGTGQE